MAVFKDAYSDYYDTGLKYEFITELAPGVWKIFRKNDRMEYLAHDVTDTLFATVDSKPQELTDYGHMLRPDGHNILQRVKIVLNHPNLVSLIDCFSLQFSDSGKLGRERWFTVWDYCDAGNLGNLLVPSQSSPQDNEEGDVELKNAEPVKFLPETFCWHVLISLLGALAWLHDGVRDLAKREDELWERQYEDLDWQPMLHRDITPQNVFIGYSRRREWYGPVKLGNYGQLFISGHCQTFGDNNAPTSSKVIGPPPGQHFAPLADLITWDSKHGSVYPPQVSLPWWRYTGLFLLVESPTNHTQWLANIEPSAKSYKP
jgi:serine/threonine protein kinase